MGGPHLGVGWKHRLGHLHLNRPAGGLKCSSRTVFSDVSVYPSRLGMQTETAGPAPARGRAQNAVFGHVPRWGFPGGAEAPGPRPPFEELCSTGTVASWLPLQGAWESHPVSHLSPLLAPP